MDIKQNSIFFAHFVQDIPMITTIKSRSEISSTEIIIPFQQKRHKQIIFSEKSAKISIKETATIDSATTNPLIH